MFTAGLESERSVVRVTTYVFSLTRTVRGTLISGYMENVNPNLTRSCLYIHVFIWSAVCARVYLTVSRFCSSSPLNAVLIQARHSTPLAAYSQPTITSSAVLLTHQKLPRSHFTILRTPTDSPATLLGTDPCLTGPDPGVDFCSRGPSTSLGTFRDAVLFCSARLLRVTVAFRSV